MKKKIALLLSLCIMMLMMLSACGTDPTTVDYNGYSYSQLEEVSKTMIEALTTLTEEDKQYFYQSGTPELISMIERWDEVSAESGAYKECGKFTVTKSGNTLTTDMIVSFENRDVDFQLVYNYLTMEQTGVTIEPVYSLGEKMSKAGLNTVISILVVFAVLIVISLIIYCFNIFPYLEKRKKANEPPAAKADVDIPAVSGMEQQEEQFTDDTELIAVIAAAIAADTGTSTSDFVVRSIRRRF